MTQDLIIVERDADDPILTITMNRPDKLNALNVELSDAIDDEVAKANANGEIRAIVLTGAGVFHWF